MVFLIRSLGFYFVWGILYAHNFSHLCDVCVCVCLCVNQPPVQTVCPNYEVVVFQPWTVTATYLGSVAIFNNFILAPPAPPVSTVSGYFYITSSSYRPPHQQPFVIITPLCSTCYPTPLLERSSVHLDVAHTRHPPSSATCICAPHRVPESSAVSRVRSSPLCRPQPAPRSLSSPGEFSCRVDLRLPCVSASPSLCVYTSPNILWCLVSLLGGCFRERLSGQGASTAKSTARLWSWC